MMMMIIDCHVALLNLPDVTHCHVVTL